MRARAILLLMLAGALAACALSAPIPPDEQRRAMVRAYWYSLPPAVLP